MKAAAKPAPEPAPEQVMERPSAVSIQRRMSLSERMEEARHKGREDAATAFWAGRSVTVVPAVVACESISELVPEPKAEGVRSPSPAKPIQFESIDADLDFSDAGKTITVHGLAGRMSALNGTAATVMHYVTPEGRYEVELEGGDHSNVKRSNVEFEASPAGNRIRNLDRVDLEDTGSSTSDVADTSSASGDEEPEREIELKTVPVAESVAGLDFDEGGNTVTLHGLDGCKSALNGTPATIIHFSFSDGRYEVQLQSGGRSSVKLENIEYASVVAAGISSGSVAVSGEELRPFTAAQRTVLASTRMTARLRCRRCDLRTHLIAISNASASSTPECAEWRARTLTISRKSDFLRSRSRG